LGRWPPPTFNNAPTRSQIAHFTLTYMRGCTAHKVVKIGTFDHSIGNAEVRSLDVDAASQEVFLQPNKWQNGFYGRDGIIYGTWPFVDNQDGEVCTYCARALADLADLACVTLHVAPPSCSLPNLQPRTIPIGTSWPHSDSLHHSYPDLRERDHPHRSAHGARVCHRL